MPFIQLPQLTPIDERGEHCIWKTCAPFAFRSERFFPGKVYVVPTDFETDLASVPRLVPFSGWYVGRANAAAALHDFLYQQGMRLGIVKSRGEADLVFLEAMLCSGVDENMAHQIYYKVVERGEIHFNDK